MPIARMSRESGGSQIAPKSGERGVGGVPIAAGVDEPVHCQAYRPRPARRRLHCIQQGGDGSEARQPWLAIW